MLGLGKTTLEQVITQRKPKVLEPPKVDIRPPDYSSVHTADINQQIRKRAVARERHPPGGRVPLRAGHMAVVLVRQLLRDQHESRAGINNSLRTRHLCPGAADPKARRRNLPEPPLCVGRDP